MNTPPSPPATRSTGHQPRPLQVAVVGGSLTGPAAALLLAAAGCEVTVFEAVPGGAGRGGGLIGLDHASLDVLDRLGVEQDEFVTATSETVIEMTVRDRRPVAARRHRYPGRNATWTRLHHALTRCLPAGTMRSGARVTGLGCQHGRPLLHLADGDSYPADLVVFADGRTSIGRALLDPARRLHYAGYVAHRGQTRALADRRHFLRLEPAPNPGMQFDLGPIPGGTDWTFYLPAPPALYAAYFGAEPQERVFVLDRHVSPAARTAVNAVALAYLPADEASIVCSTAERAAAAVTDIDPPTQMMWPVGDGHAVLLGDALAPVRPHTARGANNGIEQAAGLTAAVAQHIRHGADLRTALTGWQQRHLPAAIAAVEAGPPLAHQYGLDTAGRPSTVTPVILR